MQLIILNIYTVLFVLHFSECVKISTYNLWNVMFNWDIRKYRIAEMVRQENPDVICFQEVRSGSQPELENQILDLKALLPSKYKWHIFRVANNVSLVINSIHTEWNSEGLGLISSLPIVSKSTQILNMYGHDPDTNLRLVLHTAVQANTKMILNLVLIHISYQKQQQCRNMAEILGFIKAKNLRDIVIIGDFNIYQTYEWPVRLAVGETKTRSNPCWTYVTKYGLAHMTGTFKDAWTAAGGEANGLTFSNMPTPGLVSRPDRILVSSHLHVKSVSLLGNGSRYKDLYRPSIHWSRFTSIIHSSYLSYYGVDGYPCLHDCGPHGSCICGVCRNGGNKDTCSLKDCDICSGALFKTLVFKSILLVIIVFHLFYACILILVVGAGSYSESVFSILGCNCCLCNPKLCMRTVKVYSRRHSFLKVCQVWPVFRLPPYTQLFLSVLSFILFLTYMRSWLHDVIDLTYATMEEEFFPSDHLMLTAEIV